MNKYLVRGTLIDTDENIELFIESESPQSVRESANTLGINVSNVLICETINKEHIESRVENRLPNEQRGFEIRISNSKVIISNPLLVISVLCFSISFFLPVAGGGVLVFTGWDAFNFSFESMFSGLEEAFPLQVENNISLLDKLWINNVWLVNIFYVVIVIMIIASRQYIKPFLQAVIVGGSAIVISFGAIMTIGSDGGLFGIGYWMWLASFITLCISASKQTK